jgi:hypothetical protein
MDPRLLVPILVLSFFIRMIWACQFSLGSSPQGMKFPILRLVKVNFISSFYGLVLPGNLVTMGAASWYKLSRPTGYGIKILALLIFIRLLNTATLVIMGLAGALFDPHLASYRFIALTAAMSAGIVLLSFPFFSPRVFSILERRGQPLVHRSPLPASVRARGTSAWKTLKMFQTLHKRTIILMLSLAFLTQVVAVFVQYLLALAVGIHLSIFVIGWIRSLLGILWLIPISQAGLGVREVTLVLLLSNYGIPETQALSFSLASLSLMIFGGIVGGVLEGWDSLKGDRRVGRNVSQRDNEASMDVTIY